MSETGGVYSRDFNWVDDEGNGLDIEATRMDGDADGMASAINNRFNRDGERGPAVDLPMDTFKFLNVGNAVLRNQFSAVGQVQDNSFNYKLATGLVNTFKITLVPAVTALVVGQRFLVKANLAITDAATLQVNSTTAKPLKKVGGYALVANDIQINDLFEVVYDGTNFVILSNSNTRNGIFGDPGTEGSGITIHGTMYQSSLKVSNIGGANLAQCIMHRHSTTLPPVTIGARSHSDTNSHSIVLDGDILYGIFGAGWDGSDYEIGASITMEVDGTPGADDMPGRIVFSVTPNGSFAPVEAMRISQDKAIVFAAGVTVGSDILSDTDSTDSLGSTSARWLKGWFDTLTAGTLTIGSGSITDTSGTINFGNENLTTSGKLIIDNTTDSTSTTTGSIQTDGGLGVAKNVVVGGDITAVNSTLTGTFLINKASGNAFAEIRCASGSFSFLKLRSGTDTWDMRTKDTVNSAAWSLSYQGGVDAISVSTIGDLTVRGRIISDDTTDSTSVTTGSIQTDGGLGVAKALHVGGNVLFGALAVLSTGQQIYFDGGSNTFIDSTSGTNLRFSSNGAATYMTLDSSGNLTASGRIITDDVTDSTSTTTGSIQTDGGLGIAKALYVGTTANIAGVLTMGGNIVSDTDSTDSLGTTGVRWAAAYIDDVTVTNDVTAGGSIKGAIPNTTSSAALNLTANTHANTTTTLTGATARTFTISNDSGAWKAGDIMTFVQQGAGQLTIALEGGAGYTLNIPANRTAKTRVQYSMIVIQAISATEFTIGGDLEIV